MSDFLNLKFQMTLRSQLGADYVVLHLLGRGGSAETYLALCSSGPYRGQMFALKVFRRLSKPQWHECFLKEVEFLRNCAHPAIMRVFDEGLFSQQCPFVVAEYLPQTLASATRLRLSLIQKLSYSLQLVSAVDYLAQLSPPEA